MNKSIGGLDENVAGAFAYSLGWITGAAFLLLEPSNRFVRFHAWQSLILFGGLSLAFMIAVSTLIGGLFAFVVILPLSLALWLLLMFKAYQGELYKLPVVGPMAELQE